MVDNKQLNILVTGGKGFLGQHLTKALEVRGHRVTSFDIVDGQDLLDYNAVEKAVQGKDAVYHLAAVADLNWAREHPRETMDINIVGTINVADACTKHKAILHYASTCCAYGNPDTHPVDETTHPKPTEIYAHSKLAGEHVILGYASHFGLHYTMLRLATFYGEGMRAALAPFVFLKQAMRGEPITIHGTGEQTRTFTHVSDIVEGTARVVDSGVTNEIINITTEEEVSVNEMAHLALSLTGSNSKIIHIADRPGQIHKEEIRAAKAERLLGWKAKTKFADGLASSYAWMKAHNLHEL
ncbi:MAG: NAD-dependent epimerase/dehydratase family protein [bacterium]|nr:NAD-dependent epimerase/dehydratase family protein [bacterium]